MLLSGFCDKPQKFRHLINPNDALIVVAPWTGSSEPIGWAKFSNRGPRPAKFAPKSILDPNLHLTEFGEGSDRPVRRMTEMERLEERSRKSKRNKFKPDKDEEKEEEEEEEDWDCWQR